MPKKAPQEAVGTEEKTSLTFRIGADVALGTVAGFLVWLVLTTIFGT
jgi:hypothetical protein